MSDQDILRKNWQRLLDGLKQAGDAIETQCAGRSEIERADAYRAVMRALTANLGKVEADGRYPLPVHVNPPNQKWFIDNPDGVTLHCPVDDSQRYRLWGNVGVACYTSFTLYEGKGDGLATKATLVRTDHEIPVAADGSFELTVSAQASDDPSHLTLAPGTGQLWIRQLFNDIDHETPGWFMIENLAPDAPPPAVSVEAVVGGMKRIARGMPLLTQLMFGAWRMQTGPHPANSVRVWSEMQGGAVFTSGDCDYYIGNWQLDGDDRLVVRGVQPPCRHWNIVLYSPVLNSLEHRYRRTSLTGAQLACDGDGRYEIVIAHAKPDGAANWLDTEGRREGLFVIRVTGPQVPSQLPTTELHSRREGAMPPTALPGNGGENDRGHGPLSTGGGAQWQPAARSELAKSLYAQAAATQRHRSVSVQHILDSARRKTGLDDFGGMDFLPRLEALVDSINTEAKLNPLGLASTGTGMPVDMLRGRLELQDVHKSRPDIFTTPIERPIFIVGGSRTGTTLLQRLLGSDPRLATPILWQMASTRTFALGSDEERVMQRNRADTGQKMLHMLNPSMKAVHFSEADGPEECVLMMGTDLRNLALMSCMNTPSYSALLAREDFRESYVRHRQQLQLLDHGVRRDRAARGMAPARWLLKAPYHLPCLEALAAAYPDAIIVHTHRDVVDTVTSTCSLYSVFRSTFSDDVDPLEVGRQQVAMLTDWFNGTVAARARLAGSGVTFFDVHYRELVADPLAMAGRILQCAGLAPTEESRAAMQDWLAQNRADKHGGHRYTPEQFGIDPKALRDGMQPYRDAFGQDL